MSQPFHPACWLAAAAITAGVVVAPSALGAPQSSAGPATRASVAAQADAHFPPAAGQWEHRRPEAVGMDPQLLAQAIQFAKDNETSASRDLEQNHYLSFGREPHGEPIGPFKKRGDMTGIIVRHGYIVTEWGEPKRVDMTFSVTKSFLSTTVGLAWDRGLIRDIHDAVQAYVPTDHFDSEHNWKITWNHLLRQTSDWEGTLWGKPDWADRPPRGLPLSQYVERKRNPPGTSYKYNDVRVNVLALAALHVWRKPLPQVLKELVMDPIGASNTWRWYGYENSWVVLDGLKMQSVSGGGHWGGGMWISARDQARFGLLTLRRGRWKDEQILSEAWVEMALTPTEVEPGYGFMNWFLNTDRQRLPSAPESSFFHLGSGTNMVCAIPDYDLVIVARWINRGAMDGFVQRVLASLTDRTGEDGGER
ncbi:MAG: serine hydrolase domain-containing protein [Planctomycetota bacterium]|jgi:CubicO group peptidase (beta-lactamase class C family)